MLPIAQLLRKRARKGENVAKSPKIAKLNELDDLISSLESRREDDSESDVNTVSTDHSGGVIQEEDETGNVVKLVSSNFDDTVAPLPPTLLPVPMYKHKSKPTDREIKLKDSRAKVVKFEDENAGQGKKSVDNSGLERTIRDMLKHYEPASHEKRPFWCRICRYQGENLDDWKSHNDTSEHHLAADIERRMSYCRVCKKQFTSPDQLSNHNKGKPHQLVLDKLKAKQLQAKKFK